MTHMCLLESKFQHNMKALSVWSCFSLQAHFLRFPFIFHITAIPANISQHTILAFTFHLFAHAILHRTGRNVIPPIPTQSIQNGHTSFKNPFKQNFLCEGSYKPAPLNTAGCSFLNTQDFVQRILNPLSALILLFCKNLYASLQQLAYCDFLERKNHVLLILESKNLIQCLPHNRGST